MGNTKQHHIQKEYNKEVKEQGIDGEQGWEEICQGNPIWRLRKNKQKRIHGKTQRKIKGGRRKAKGSRGSNGKWKWQKRRKSKEKKRKEEKKRRRKKNRERAERIEKEEKRKKKRKGKEERKPKKERGGKSKKDKRKNERKYQQGKGNGKYKQLGKYMLPRERSTATTTTRMGKEENPEKGTKRGQTQI